MKASQIEIGATYVASVDGEIVALRVDQRYTVHRYHHPQTHYRCTNTMNGERVTIQCVTRFRRRLGGAT